MKKIKKKNKEKRQEIYFFKPVYQQSSCYDLQFLEYRA